MVSLSSVDGIDNPLCYKIHHLDDRTTIATRVQCDDLVDCIESISAYRFATKDLFSISGEYVFML